MSSLEELFAKLPVPGVLYDGGREVGPCECYVDSEEGGQMTGAILLRGGATMDRRRPHELVLDDGRRFALTLLEETLFIDHNQGSVASYRFTGRVIV